VKRKIILKALLLCVTLCVPFSLFSQDFEINETVLVKYRGNAENVTIPDGITAIGDGAFSYCGSLRSITIPKSVISIGDNAFYVCSNIGTVVVSRGTTIGNEVFPDATRIIYSD